MKFPAFLASALALTIACGQIGVSTAIARTAKASHGQEAPAVNVDTNVVFDKTDGVLKYRSPFDAETSVKLSAIVRKAKNSIDSFDDKIGAIRATVQAGALAPPQSKNWMRAQAALKELEAMHQPVIKAKAEMVVARDKLVKSRKYYNNIVLSGMEEFIRRVDNEFNDETKTLTSKLQHS